MKVLFDTNIVLDVLMDRMPFAEAAVRLFSQVEEGILVGSLCATSITTIHYLISKAIGSGRAQKEMQKLLRLFEIIPVNRRVLESALVSDFNDFEDAVIHAAACSAGIDAIVTRDRKDYRKAQIAVYTSIELSKILHTEQSKY